MLFFLLLVCAMFYIIGVGWFFLCCGLWEHMMACSMYETVLCTFLLCCNGPFFSYRVVWYWWWGVIKTATYNFTFLCDLSLCKFVYDGVCCVCVYFWNWDFYILYCFVVCVFAFIIFLVPFILSFFCWLFNFHQI